MQVLVFNCAVLNGSGSTMVNMCYLTKKSKEAAGKSCCTVPHPAHLEFTIPACARSGACAFACDAQPGGLKTPAH